MSHPVPLTRHGGLDPTAVVNALARVITPPAVLHEPLIDGNEWHRVKDCLDTGWVSSAGPYVDRFEDMISDFTGVRHVIATVNGTAALHVCLMLAGVRPDDEVIVPALTFVGTANAVAYCHARPHFADSEIRTLGLDPVKLEEHLEEIAVVGADGCLNTKTGRRIAAVVVVHAFGHPADVDALAAVCNRFGLPLIEDAAASLGSFYKGRHTGHGGLLAALSFNGNKIVTTGGGGGVLTNDESLARRAKHLTTTAKRPHPWEYVHDAVGFNYRLPNINAALGSAQMERLPAFLKRKRRLAERYRGAIADCPGLRFVAEPEHCRSNYWLNAILLDRDCADLRDEILDATNSAGFMCRPAWTPLHRLDMYRESPRTDLSVAEDMYRRLLNIPSGAALVEADADVAP